MKKKLMTIIISCIVGFGMMQSNIQSVIPKQVYAAKIVKAKKVSLNKSVYTIKKGKKIKLKATITPKNSNQKKIIWTSDQKKIATVASNGVVTGKKNGTAIIKAKIKGTNKIAKCKIIVGIPVKTINLERKNITMTEGDKITIKKTISPNNASIKTVTYSSSDKNIVQVDKAGKLIAKKAGTAQIKVITKDGTGKKAVCNVLVKRKIAKKTEEVDKWNYTLA